MPTYSDLKAELGDISQLLEKFPEGLRPRVFELLVAEFTGRHKAEATASDLPPSDAADVPEGRAARRRASAKESYTVLKELDLYGKGGGQTLAAFVEKHPPTSALEFNAVSVAYLQSVGVHPITLDHIYTCYKAVGRALPTQLKQSVYDSSRGDWSYVDVSDWNAIKLSLRGENLVEQELPNRPKKAIKQQTSK